MSEYDPNYKPQKSYTLIGQKAVITNMLREVLVLQRSSKSGAGGKWSLPGGGLDRGEDPFESIKREIKEETGLVVHNINLFSARTYMSPQDDFVMILGYVCNRDSEKIDLNWEHDDYKWLSAADALSLDLTPDARFFIEKIKSEKDTQ